VRQLAVVREQEQPLRILVEPPDRGQGTAAQLRREQVEHRLLPPVLRRGQDARGLVEHDVGELFIAQRLAIEQDHGGLRVDLHVGGGGGLAVHENAALPHHLAHLPP